MLREISHPFPMPKIIPEIVEQHAEEVAVLWLLRDAGVRAPHYSLADLAKLDGRVEAHLNGLRIAEDPGWEICKQNLRWQEVGEVFAAAVLAFESGSQDRVRQVLSVAVASSDVSRGVISALGWLPYEQAEKHIQPLLAAEAPLLRRVGIAAMAIHRQNPRRALSDALADGHPLPRARAIGAVAELGRADLRSLLREHLGEKDALCRSAAARSVALLAEDGDALGALRDEVETGGDGAAGALQLVLRRMGTTEGREWLSQLARQPAQLRQAVIGAGVLGVPEAVPWLMEMMHLPGVARVAGEAFSAIAGANIAYSMIAHPIITSDNLEGEWPEGFQAGPTEDPRDDNVAMDPDENLPWPDPKKIAAWWQRRRDGFQAGTRYLLGKPLSEDWLQEVLRYGRQRQRAAAAMELAIRRPGQPLFEVRAPGPRQRELLALKQPGK